MTADRWTKLATLVPDALDLAPEARAAFLDDACRQPTGEVDAALRAEAQALVKAAEDATETGALRSPLAGLAGELAGEEGLAAVAPPETVGPWRVTGVLGEGGQAVVYRAVRADGAFEREVALKLLRPGVGNERLAARLAEERRVLGSLEHPGIARLYDGGLTDGGQPYLAMELVDGAPITAAADGLDLRPTVALLAEVCDAVAYAHARLVVHRDLKPSNVLVTGVRGRGLGVGASSDAPPQSPTPSPQHPPRPKLLDFGVAKLLGDETDPDLTVPGWMTPAYAAPEQVQGRDVTTATDVYALGVLAYEVLAGRRPYETAGLSPAETERVVCDETPPLASATAASAAADRARALRGDLDTILAKALAKEPGRRYESASALADDLRRWLGGLPVEARPATAGYRGRRFVQRNRTAVVAASLALAVVVGVAAVAFVRVVSERDRAEQALIETEGAFAFVEDAFLLGTPEEGAVDLPISVVLDSAAARVERVSNPAVAALIHNTLATVNAAQERWDQAGSHARRALALLPDAPSGQRALALSTLGQVQGELGDLDEAAVTLAQSLALLKSLPSTPETDVEIANVYSIYGLVLATNERLDEAEAAYNEGLTYTPAQGEERATLLNNLALLLANAGQYVEGAAAFGRAADMLRAAGPSSRSELATVLANQAAVLSTAGTREDSLVFEALPIYEEALAVGESVSRPDDPDLLWTRANYSFDLARAGYAARAFREADSTAATALRALGPGHEVTAHALAIAAALACTGYDAAGTGPDPARGLRFARTALATRRDLLPEGHPMASVTESIVGVCLARLGRTREALSMLRASHAALVASVGQDNAFTRTAKVRLESAGG